MRKVCQIVVLLLWTVGASAQNGLQGTWVMSHGALGVKVTNTMTFSSDTRGTVTNKYAVTMDISQMGTKVSGETEISECGTFIYDGSTLTINWDRNSLVTTSKAVEVTKDGEPVPDAARKFQDMMNEISDVMSSVEMSVDSYTEVKIKTDRISLDGDKFKRVK